MGRPPEIPPSPAVRGGRHREPGAFERSNDGLRNIAIAASPGLGQRRPPSGRCPASDGVIRGKTGRRCDPLGKTPFPESGCPTEGARRRSGARCWLLDHPTTARSFLLRTMTGHAPRARCRPGVSGAGDTGDDDDAHPGCTPGTTPSRRHGGTEREPGTGPIGRSSPKGTGRSQRGRDGPTLPVVSGPVIQAHQGHDKGAGPLAQASPGSARGSSMLGSGTGRSFTALARSVCQRRPERLRLLGRVEVVRISQSYPTLPSAEPRR